MRLHLNKRGTSVVSKNFVGEISNVFQWQYISRSPSGEFVALTKAFDALNQVVVAHLNINLIRNTFKALIQNISGQVGLLMISKTKINKSFPKIQFLAKGFSDLFRMDGNIPGGGILLYVREDISTKLLSSDCFLVELNLHKRKWLISSS